MSTGAYTNQVFAVPAGNVMEDEAVISKITWNSWTRWQFFATFTRSFVQTAISSFVSVFFQFVRHQLVILWVSFVEAGIYNKVLSWRADACSSHCSLTLMCCVKWQHAFSKVHYKACCGFGEETTAGVPVDAAVSNYEVFPRQPSYSVSLFLDHYQAPKLDWLLPSLFCLVHSLFPLSPFFLILIAITFSLVNFFWKSSFCALSVQVNGIRYCRNGHHHHHQRAEILACSCVNTCTFENMSFVWRLYCSTNLTPWPPPSSPAVPTPCHSTYSRKHFELTVFFFVSVF